MQETANQSAGPRVDPDQPWLGLHPFAEENRAYFFGRTPEIREIFERVRQNALTILYGQSGWGKTSLLRAACCRSFATSVSVRRTYFWISLPRRLRLLLRYDRS